MHNTTLKELQLDFCAVSDIGFESLADMLVNNTTLETLSISDMNVLAKSRSTC